MLLFSLLFMLSQNSDLQSWTKANPWFHTRLSVLNDSSASPNTHSPLKKPTWKMGKWVQNIWQSSMLCNSGCRPVSSQLSITISYNADGHKHCFQRCSMKPSNGLIVWKLAWLISENCQWLANYSLNWAQIATKSYTSHTTWCLSFLPAFTLGIK